jgi:ATP-dependent helicase HrpB
MDVRCALDLQGTLDVLVRPTGVEVFSPSRDLPDRHELPGGRKARLLYKATGQVTMSALIQDLYGVTSAPKLAGGKAEVTVEILAPNRRPIQITKDLNSFWKETYPKIKPELSRRYPKHKWL